MAKSSEYNNESIVVLKDEQRVRQKPEVMLGSRNLAACEHAVFEVIANSADEARLGYGKEIIITRFEDDSIEVLDFGRGIPVDYNKREKEYNWKLIFIEMFAGGKYSGDGYTLGTNGVGLSAVQCASEYMEAEIKRDGFRYCLKFKEGRPVGKMLKEEYKGKDTGTRIKFRLDLKVFTDIDSVKIPVEDLEIILKRQAAVNPGTVFVLRVENGGSFEEHKFCYKDGIAGYLRDVVKEEMITDIQKGTVETKCRDREGAPFYKMKAEVFFGFSNKVQMKEYFHNGGFLKNGGSPDRAVRSAFTSQIDAYLKANGKYNKSDPKITFKDIEDCLIIVTSSFSTFTSYENQTKMALNNKGIQDALTEFLKNQIEIYFTENPVDANKITEQILINMRSRTRSEKERISLKKTMTETSGKNAKRVEKFVDCRSKDVSKRELFIVEGDSALGSCKQSRNADFQAVMPLRGKIKNCQKNGIDSIMDSDIIVDLVRVFGCGISSKFKAGARKGFPSFNLDLLKWDKIIICTDADVDGFHIRTLIVAMIYRLMPELIDAGKVFVAESPLYEINCGDETWFAYTEREKTAVEKKLKNKKYTIQRSKGLGENTAEMMSLTTMNPETRRLIKIVPDAANDSENLISILLGNKQEERKRYIDKFGYLYANSEEAEDA